jgi:hypothetical protein
MTWNLSFFSIATEGRSAERKSDIASPAIAIFDERRVELRAKHLLSQRDMRFRSPGQIPIIPPIASDQSGKRAKSNLGEFSLDT